MTPFQKKIIEGWISETGIKEGEFVRLSFKKKKYSGYWVVKCVENGVAHMQEEKDIFK